MQPMKLSYQRMLVSSLSFYLDATSRSFSKLFASSQEKLASGMTAIYAGETIC
jgi:hypothetical protein